MNNLILELNSICNNNCSYCYLDKKQEKGEDSFEFFKSELIKYSNKGIKNVDFTGGEPTLYTDLFKIIQIAKNLKYQNLTLVTNGRMLSNEEYLESLVKSGITRIVISIDGPNEEISDSITRTKNSFKQVLKALNNINQLKNKVELGMTIVVVKQNYQSMKDIAEMCIKNNADFLNIQYMLPYIDDEHVSCRKIPSAIIPTYEETIPFLKELLKELGDQIKINVHYLPFCQIEGFEEYLIRESNKDDRIVLNYNKFQYNVGHHLKKGSEKKNICKDCKFEEICIGIYKSYKKELGYKNE